MDPTELAGHGENVLVLDVRGPDEWDAGHIPGSRHVPGHELGDRLEELARDRPVVAVCRSGSRSATATAVLRDAGFDAQNLDGGLEAWHRVGLPLVAADGGAGRVVDPAPPPGGGPSRHQHLQDEMLSVLFAVHEHFGDRQPADDEVRQFLRQRLRDEGSTAEEAEEFMARLDDG